MSLSLDELNGVPADAAERPTAAPRVIHWRDRDQYGNATYVGRAMSRQGIAGSPFANPYLVDVDGTRAEVITKYRQRLLGQPALLDRLHELRGRRLACWCSPEPCHADVLVELVDADELLDELKAAGVRVEATEGRLRLLPASNVSEALVARVRPLKGAILALLASRPPLPEASATWLAAVDRLASEQQIPPDVLAELKAAKAKWR